MTGVVPLPPQYSSFGSFQYPRVNWNGKLEPHTTVSGLPKFCHCGVGPSSSLLMKEPR